MEQKTSEGEIIDGLCGLFTMCGFTLAELRERLRRDDEESRLNKKLDKKYPAKNKKRRK